MKTINASDYNRHPSVSIDCPACGKRSRGFVYSRAFSSEEETICDQCGTQQLFSHSGPVFDYFQQKAKLDEKTAHAFLRPCACGGRFVSANFRFDLYRCPDCSKRFPENVIEKILGIQGATGVKMPYDGRPVGHPDVSLTWPGLLFPPIREPELVEEVWDLSSPGQQLEEALRQEEIRQQKEASRREQCEELERKVERVRTRCAEGISPEHLHYGPGGFTFQLEEDGKSFAIDPSPVVDPRLLPICKEWEENCRIFDDLRSQYADHRMEATTARNTCPSFEEHYEQYDLIRDVLTETLGNHCNLTFTPYTFTHEEETYTRIAFEHYQIPPPYLCLYLDGIYLKLSRYSPWRIAFNTGKCFPTLFLHVYHEWATLAEYLEAVERGFCIQSNPGYARLDRTNPTQKDRISLEKHLKDYLENWMKLDCGILFYSLSHMDRERPDWPEYPLFPD